MFPERLNRASPDEAPGDHTDLHATLFVIKVLKLNFRQSFNFAVFVLRSDYR